MKAIIVDDEELARKRILNLLEEVAEIEVVGECTNGKTAIEKINRLAPQLVFLDINMKDMNGFEVLQNIKLEQKPIVVLVTAYDGYATKAFDVDAFDFLLKPFKDQRFHKAISKVLKISRSEADNQFEKRISDLFLMYSQEKKKAAPVARIPVKQGNKTILLNPSNILYILASGYYAEIFSEKNKYVLRESLSNLEGILDDAFFCRIHRSTIININHLKEIVHSEYSEVDAKMSDGKLLHISKSNKKEFLEKIGM
ncbi:LytR/AlgR family response regulator transcription factor [Salinimicrobium sp. GXAS 041]|uniref:LytR/AlgR family response regulator transcription factor n=1 Tax=Salinimicrobium sp. GXAS 041 TaxID=3400806 RepID=UPI003C775CAB